ncbi:MAG TPA: ATP-binding protein [Pseudolabrys sp.]|jgi:signal transduction histidine kinase|nr:ATP-binding protein [Pseudolabrys sp.]
MPDSLSQRWVGSIGLAAAVGLAYFLTAKFSVGLVLEPAGVAVFWPAAGISSGLLIALGPRGRWPVLAGVMLATIATHLIINDPLWAGVTLGLSNGAEALITAALIHHYFGPDFNLVRVRHVVGLLAAAVAATTVSGIGGAVTYRLMRGPSVPMLDSWQHWFASDFVGIIAVAPLVIGVAAVVRRPSPRSEVIEGTLGLVALALVTGLIISLPRGLWETVFPITWLFPVFAWLAARTRPAFCAAGAFVVSITIVLTTILGIGHFGDPSIPVTDRVLEAQAGILVVALSAYVLAAIFAQRRESATYLAHSNAMLERERDNKLLSAQALTAAIVHEVRQPLTAVSVNGSAALQFLRKTPPNLAEVRTALNDIIRDTHRTNEVLEGIRALFGKSHQKREQVDVNELILGVLQSSRKDLQDHGVETRLELASELPLVDGHRRQLEEVIFNLVHNAIEAMDATTDRDRLLQARTELSDHNAITVAVRDSGPGIDPQRLDSIFGAFVTTKSHGMGLGLAICRMIIERHGGRLTASSDGKNGSLFQVVLPTISRVKNATS